MWSRIGFTGGSPESVTLKTEGKKKNNTSNKLCDVFSIEVSHVQEFRVLVEGVHRGLGSLKGFCNEQAMNSMHVS